MKASSRFLSVFLVLALMLSCSACASGTGAAAGAEEAGEEAAGEEAAGEGFSAEEKSTTGLFLALTESTSKSLAFPLTEEQAAQVERAGADQVTWSPVSSSVSLRGKSIIIVDLLTKIC
ncbi:MAG: hypothetical protein U0L10_02225 [Lachnospiraceae bacterium]|nr:hypothetical protein [Lachnospiraceae bacterium]